jgi:hypothetical protein
MRYSEQTPCAVRNCKGARSNGLAVTGSAQAVGSANGRLIHHWVVSGQLLEGLTFTIRSHKRAPELGCALGVGAPAQRARALGVTV